MISRELNVYSDDADGYLIVTLDDKIMEVIHCNDGYWNDRFDSIYQALGADINHLDYEDIPDKIKKELFDNHGITAEDLSGEEE